MPSPRCVSLRPLLCIHSCLHACASLVSRQLTSAVDLPPVRLLSLIGSAPLPALAPAIVCGFGQTQTTVMLQPTSNVRRRRGVDWGGLWLGAAKAVSQSSSATSRVLRQRGSGPDYMKQLVETGYVCVPDGTDLAAGARATLAAQPCSYHQLPQPGCDDIPASDSARAFVPIFQGYPSAGCSVNCGDKLRQVCAGRVQHRMDSAAWCAHLSDAQLCAARADGIDAVMDSHT